MSHHLFLFSIGPVQSFIGQARKTRDLYAASQLLSDLTWAGFKAFAINKGTPIFPFVASTERKPVALPNRFLGRISVNKEADLAAIGQAVEKAVRKTFEESAWNILHRKQLSSTLYEAKAKRAWQRQIDTFLDVHWLFVLISDDTPQAYQSAYERINQRLGAIKNERRFEQRPERGRKCLLDGERNALFYRPNESDQRPAMLEYNMGAMPVRQVLGEGLYPGEALSAIGMLKRFYREDAFPATATIATMSSVSHLEEFSEWQSYKASVTQYADWDEQLLYADNLTEPYLRRQGYTQLIEQLSNLKNTYQQLVQRRREEQLLFGKYYALLVFDGDAAGQWVSGEFLAPGSDLRTYHSKISEFLGDYARKATEYLRVPFGKTVFAGGDDFIGFINLDYLFDVLLHLREQFDKLVNQKLKSSFAIQANSNFTFSAGIAIAHYKEPLGDVLRIARRFEHRSKEYPAKNAFSIAIVRRSDHLDSSYLTLPWTVDGPDAKPQSLIRLLQRIAGMLQFRRVNKQRHSPYFSTNFVGKLHQTLRDFGDHPDPRLVQPRLAHYVSRSYTGPPDQKEEHVQLLTSDIHQLWQLLTPSDFVTALDGLTFISKHLNPARSDA